MSQTIEFTASSFPSILLRDNLDKTWNEISLSSLSPTESAPLLLFFEDIDAANNSDFDPDKILLVKASRGIPQGIYTPSIFRDDDSIVIKFGVNIFLVTQKEDKFYVGSLAGKMNVTEAKDKDNNPYPKASITFISEQHDDIFKLPVNLASKELNFTAGQVEAALLKNKPILQFLRQVPTGGGMKMHELGIGEFQLRSISESEGEYGTIHKLHLMDGRVVLSTGNVTTILNSNWRPTWEKPVTLVVSDIQEIGEDKYSVDCALRERLPVLPSSTPSTGGKPHNGTAPSTQTVTVSAKSVKADNGEPEELDF